MFETGKRITMEIRTLGLPEAINPRVGVVFWRTLLDSLPVVLGWGIGYGVLIALVVILYPTLQSNETMLNVVQGLGLFSMFSNAAIDVGMMTSFGGYLAIQAFGWAPLILSVFMMSQAMNAVIREEERGTLDILLSMPIPRWRFLVEKALATLVALVGILFLMGTSLLVSAALVEGADIDVGNAIAGVWHVLPISMVIYCAALLFSMIFNSTRAAMGWSAVLVIGSYFIRTISDIAGDVAWVQVLRRFSIFHYYSSIRTLAVGLQIELDIFLLIVALVLFLLALWRFRHHDIGV